MTEKLSCRECKNLILQSTSEKTGGLCMPCNGGYRINIENAKESSKIERELDKTCPFQAYWRELVERVHEKEEDVEHLSDDEKLYFAVKVLEGEVNNGGFVQFFDNSSFMYFRYAELGLIQMGATARLALLRAAKREIFGQHPIPSDAITRFNFTNRVPDDSPLNELDSQYYKLDDGIDGKLEEYATSRGLVVIAD